MGLMVALLLCGAEASGVETAARYFTNVTGVRTPTGWEDMNEWWLGILVVAPLVWAILGFQPMLFTMFFGGIGLTTFWVRRHPELLPKMPDFSYAKPQKKTQPKPIYRQPLVLEPPVQNRQKPR